LRSIGGRTGGSGQIAHAPVQTGSTTTRSGTPARTGTTPRTPGIPARTPGTPAWTDGARAREGGRRAVRAATAALIAAAAGIVLPAPASAAPDPKPNPRQWYLTAWNVERAVWPISQGEGVTVAIVDRGVDDGYRLHELRNGVVLPGVDISGYDEDSKGKADVNGHGTFMALLVAARGGGNGATGIAPKSTILPVKILSGVDTQKGIRWAADHGAQVINMSIAHIRIGEHCSANLQSAINYAIERDVVIVAAAGNEGDEENNVLEPASCPGVLAVGAVDQSGRPWVKTQRHDYVDVAAPGADLPVRDYYGEWTKTSGTSNSSALVAGLAALVRAKFPDASAREVVQRIIATARDTGPPGHDDTTGYGIVDPARALTADVPADAPNPVFAEYDAEVERREKAEQREKLVGILPWAIGGLCLAGIVATVVILIVWSVRRDRRARQAHLAAGGWGKP